MASVPYKNAQHEFFPPSWNQRGQELRIFGTLVPLDHHPRSKMFLKPEGKKAVGANADHEGELEGPGSSREAVVSRVPPSLQGRIFGDPLPEPTTRWMAAGPVQSQPQRKSLFSTLLCWPQGLHAASEQTLRTENLNGHLNHYYAIWIVVTSLDPSPLTWKVEGRIKQSVRHCPGLTIRHISSVFFKVTIVQLLSTLIIQLTSKVVNVHIQQSTSEGSSI